LYVVRCTYDAAHAARRTEDTTGAFRWEDKVGTNKKGETVRFKEIHVRPCFV
jgi:hypothetical protein